jgi:hypothetical protein
MHADFFLFLKNSCQEEKDITSLALGNLLASWLDLAFGVRDNQPSAFLRGHHAYPWYCGITVISDEFVNVSTRPPMYPNGQAHDICMFSPILMA